GILNRREDSPSFRIYLNERKALLNFLREDIGRGDITSNSVLKPNLLASSTILCKDSEQAVVAGLREVGIVFDLCKCSCTALVDEGSMVSRGNEVMRIKGRARDILKAERTALNLLMRMSGIATETKKFVEVVKKISKDIEIAGTRKTAPGLRSFDKKAIKIGGGRTHRNSLDEMVLIKDNHLVLTGSIGESISSAKKLVGNNIKVECEVTDLQSAIEAINFGADVIMLDNFSPQEVENATRVLKELGLRQKCLLEISGGISLANVSQFAKSNPDIISVGSLTHSVKSVDFSLEVDSCC
ncbi:MAG TPA: carboxylating nicotinate-nucleotide diphosphorylase, partial [Nitrososphaeraceae archaeon]|nr:carboxylating nicotinate-nucleotide diphosphorylase [Nitrososphaeraceae archaeon]